MSEKVHHDVRSISARSIWFSRALKVACVTFAMGLGACMAETGDEDADSNSQGATANQCQGQATGALICSDDTHFQTCVAGDSRIFITQCAAGTHCVTSGGNHTGNPCVAGAAAGGQVVNQTPPANNNNNNVTPPPPANNGGVVCSADGSPGPKFDAAGPKNIGNGVGGQFITGQCLSNADCASGCCAKPCGICSGPQASFQNGKQGCGFLDDNVGQAAPPAPPAVKPPPPPPPANNNLGNGDFRGANGVVCHADGTPGVKFDAAGLTAHPGQFITGRCNSNADCASGCCAKPCGVCSGPAVGNVFPKTGCGFVAGQ